MPTCSPRGGPADGRYGENPNRLYKHQQFQVILKPSPADVQDLYLDSLRALGIDPAQHDVRFEEDNWESPTLGRLGHRLAGAARRPGDHAVHLLPAGGRDRPGADLGRDHLRPRADRDVPAGRGRRLRRALVRRTCSTATCATRRSSSSRATRSSWPTSELHRRLFESALAEGWRAAELEGGRSLPAGLRLVPEELARLQRARRARRDLGQPARGHDPAASASWPAPSPKAYVDARHAATRRGRPARPRVPELLLEVGCEEMPAPWLPGLAEQLRPALRGARPAASTWSREDARRRLDAAPAGAARPSCWRARPTARSRSGGRRSRWRRTRRASGRRPRRASRRRAASAAERLLQRPKDEASAGELNLLFVKKRAGRADARGAAGADGRDCCARWPSRSA